MYNPKMYNEASKHHKFTDNYFKYIPIPFELIFIKK